MDLTFRDGDLDDLKKCADILSGSELGQDYFIDVNGIYQGEKLLKEGFERREITVAVDEGGSCRAFAWVVPRGIFLWYDFIHVIAVERGFRNRGIGEEILGYIEGRSRKKGESKLFLIVHEDNTTAMSLYRKSGFMITGKLPGLFLRDNTEMLMMKDLPGNSTDHRMHQE